MFPYIRQLLQKQYPTIKIIPWDKFTHGSAAIGEDPKVDLAAELKAVGCQGAIVGNAG